MGPTWLMGAQRALMSKMSYTCKGLVCHVTIQSQSARSHSRGVIVHRQGHWGHLRILASTARPLGPSDSCLHPHAKCSHPSPGNPESSPKSRRLNHLDQAWSGPWVCAAPVLGLIPLLCLGTVAPGTGCLPGSQHAVVGGIDNSARLKGERGGEESLVQGCCNLQPGSPSWSSVVKFQGLGTPSRWAPLGSSLPSFPAGSRCLPLNLCQRPLVGSLFQLVLCPSNRSWHCYC